MSMIRNMHGKTIRPAHGRMIMRTSSGLSYVLRDEFTTALSAGSVNGTNCDPGPGTRYVADTANLLSISGGELQFGGYTAANDPIYSIPVAVPRVPGRMICSQFTTPGADNCSFRIGFGSDGLTLPKDAGFFLQRSSLAADKTLYALDTVTRRCGVLEDSTEYTTLAALRAAGSFFFLWGDAYTVPTLMYVANVSASDPVYPTAAIQYDTAYVINYIRVPSSLWLPTPLASDGFNRADGALGSTDGLGHAEGVSGGLGAGGSGIAWTDSVGTWAVSSNKAVCSALSGGIGVATVNLSTANAHVIAAVTRSAGNAGIVARYVDASNHLYAYHNGTNAVLVKKVAGVDETLVNAAAAYSAGANLCVITDGTEYRLYYNHVFIGSGTSAGLPSGTRAGLFTSDTGNGFDNVMVYARGTEGQYSFLTKY